MFCEKCGKEITEGAVICMGCGCPVESDRAAQTSPVQTAAKKSFVQTMWNDPKKKIILIVIAAILAVGIIIGGYFLVNFIRVQSVINELAGSTYVYRDGSGRYLSTYKLTFDDDRCEFNNYYGALGTSLDYSRSYVVKCEFGGDIIVKMIPGDDFKVNKKMNGEIYSLTNIETGEKYEKID